MEETPWDEMPAVVLDNGSGNVKCGFAGEDVPRSVFPAILGKPRNGSGDILVGAEALEQKGLRYSYPMEHGIVLDWDGLERLWRFAFEDIKADPTKQAVLVTEAPLNPKENREKMAETMFETFQVPGLHFQIQAVLSLYSAGRTDGLVLDSGDGVTHVVPIFEGHTIPSAIRRLELAGRDLTEWMMELLTDELDRPFTTSAEREIARQIKEKFAYISQDFDEELEAYEMNAGVEDESGSNEMYSTFTLPDGEQIKIGRSRFCCPELLFNPSLAEKPYTGFHESLVASLNLCPIDLRRTLLNNIVICGGNTMFRGLPQRLQREVASLVNANAAEDVRVVAANERKFSVWIGAAILASLTSFTAEWITKEEYDEQGPSVVHRRCDALTFVGK